jgi:O-antigen/teichoic acid export membrane protein
MLLLFGRQFAGAYQPLMILMAVPFIGVFTFPLGPMLYALGRSEGPLRARLLGSILFFGMIAPLSWTWGVTGAALALVVANFANAVALLVQLISERRRLQSA